MEVGTVKQISEHHCPATSFTLATTERESQGFLWNRNSRFVFLITTDMGYNAKMCC